MIIILSSIVLILLIILVYSAYKSSNIFLQSLSYFSVFVLIPLYFISFVFTTGEPRQIIWDKYFNKHNAKMRVVSYLIKDKDIYLWLARDEDIPVYYVALNTTKEEREQLEAEAKKAIKGQGILYYKFEDSMLGEKNNSDETGQGGIEGTTHRNIFETQDPRSQLFPEKEKQENYEILEFPEMEPENY